VTIAYDNRSRVSSVTDVFGQVVSYAYDANSNRTQLSLNGGTSATYQYDVINRLTQLTDNASLNTTFAYDPTNKLTARSLPNGVAASYQYNRLNRLTRLTHAKGGNTLADFQYQFNAVGNITQMTDGAGANNYTYDPLDRVTAATFLSVPLHADLGSTFPTILSKEKRTGMNAWPIKRSRARRFFIRRHGARNVAVINWNLRVLRLQLWWTTAQ
jgi:YD repeat-containing protein